MLLETLAASPMRVVVGKFRGHRVTQVMTLNMSAAPTDICVSQAVVRPYPGYETDRLNLVRAW